MGQAVDSMGRGKLGRDGVNGLLRVGRGRKAVIFNGFGHFRLRGRSVKEGLPDAGSIVVAAAEGVRVDAEGRACILMPHAAGDGYRVDDVGKQCAGVRVPLRYNYNTRRVQRNLGVLTPMEKHTLCLAA